METPNPETLNTDPRERRNRSWIVILALVAMLSCALLVVGAGAIGWLRMRSGGEHVEVAGNPQRIERSFEVGAAPELVVQNSAGQVTVSAGEGNTIHITATKRNGTPAQLESIEVILEQEGDRVSVETRRPFSMGRGSVDYVIIVPVSTRVNLHASAGSIHLSGTAGAVEAESSAGSITIAETTGDVVAHASAGSIDVRDAVGAVDLHASAGSINYSGSPRGRCTFDSSAGSVKITLPESPNVTLDLSTSAGRVDVSLPVEGEVTRKAVRGVVGNGQDATIIGRASAGSITVR